MITIERASTISLDVLFLGIGLIVLPFVLTGENIFEDDPMVQHSSLLTLMGITSDQVRFQNWGFQLAYWYAEHFWLRFSIFVLVMVTQCSCPFWANSPKTESLVFHGVLWISLVAMSLSLYGLIAAIG